MVLVLCVLESTAPARKRLKVAILRWIVLSIELSYEEGGQRWGEVWEASKFKKTVQLLIIGQQQLAFLDANIHMHMMVRKVG
jgi:hypothetical protein